MVCFHAVAGTVGSFQRPRDRSGPGLCPGRLAKVTFIATFRPYNDLGYVSFSFAA